ncbi:MAG: protoporphyrinogen oxidase [Pseudomonadota bacterium]|nr:protoporphyrinogen oxidase [Pseudomonadota bacterium]
MRIAIIGGGISGLSTAFYVRQLRPTWEVTILERDDRLGGTMRTTEVDGFRFEQGSNGFLSNKPDTLDLVKASGAEHLLLSSSDAARIRFIYKDALHRLPESPPAFLGTGLLSWRGKLRTLGEVLVPALKDAPDETVQSFGYRRVGREFTDTFLNAMTAGIYGSTPEALSVKAAFPLVVALERDHGGLFRGMIRKRKKEAGPGGILMSFVSGVSSYIEHLRETLDADVRTGVRVEGVSYAQGRYTLHTGDESLEADKLVLATPAYVAADLVRDMDAAAAHRLEQVAYSPISVVGLGYHRLEHPLKGFGLLTTASARKPILGVLWDSSIFPDRAPQGAKAMRVMIGGQRNPELALQEDDRLVDTALRGIRETMGVDDAPDVTFVKRWDRGIPNYRVGHLSNIDALFEQLRACPGLHLNSNAYYGIALNDCVRNSRETARKVASDS